MIELDGELAGGELDSFRALHGAERLASRGPAGTAWRCRPLRLPRERGRTGVRRLYLEKMALRCCFSFENRKKLFEIHASFKFALVVAGKPGPTTEFPCAFYLHDMDWLFGDRSGRELRYSLEFVRRTGGEYLSLLELDQPADSTRRRPASRATKPFGPGCERLESSRPSRAAHDG